MIQTGGRGDRKPSRNKILCIEDNISNRTLLREIFRLREDVEFIESGSAEEGLELALSCLPDLILVDIRLPGMNGMDFLQILREQEMLKHTPVVALTGEQRLTDASGTASPNFDAMLYKPYSIDTLMETVDLQLTKCRG